MSPHPVVIAGRTEPVRDCPSFAFDPRDPWTRAFQEGLVRADLSGLRAYEVGVGTGTNVLHLLQRCGVARVLGSDLDPRLPDLAARQVQREAPWLRDRFQPLLGSTSLVDTPEARTAVSSVDVVVACLPQVPDIGDDTYRRVQQTILGDPAVAVRRTDDHIAHYYPWSSFQDHPFNVVGFGLNEALLRSLRAVAPSAEVFLALSCRAGSEVVERLFTANGYTPDTVAEHIVPQSGDTTVDFFEMLEATGYRCEFYADPAGRIGIDACEAGRRVRSGRGASVHHALRVVRGRPRSVTQG